GSRPSLAAHARLRALARRGHAPGRDADGGPSCAGSSAAIAPELGAGWARREIVSRGRTGERKSCRNFKTDHKKWAKTLAPLRRNDKYNSPVRRSSRPTPTKVRGTCPE